MSEDDDNAGQEATARSIGRAAGKGLRWSLMGSAATRLGTFVMGLVLARLLTPEDFGLYAVALAAMYFVMHVNDVGIMAATVQWRGRLEEMAPTATTLALMFSALVYGLCWFAAPAFATLAGSSEAAPIVRLLTAVILIDGVTAVRAGSLLRSFQQDRIIIANLCGVVVNAAVAISLAARGAGAYSFAAGQVAGAVVIGVIVFWLAKLPTQLGFDGGVARKLMRFGLPLALGLGMEAVVFNVDYVIVGHALGATALGFYLLAFNVSSWATGVIGTAIRYVSVPSFSRLSEDEGSLSPGVQRSFTLLITSVVPIALLMAVLAPALVVFLYGDQWAPAAPVLRFLAILSVVRIVVQLVVDVLTGAGATRVAMWMNAGWVLALVPALMLGTRLDGIRGTAIAHVLVALLVALPLALMSLRRIGVQVAPIVPRLIRPLVAGVVAALVCALVADLTSTSVFLQLATAGTAGLLTYLAVVVPRQQLQTWSGRASELIAASMR